MRIVISDDAKAELDRLNLDLETMIQNLLNYVPSLDRIGVSHIYVTPEPEDSKDQQKRPLGVYYRKRENRSAFIGLYTKNFSILRQNRETVSQAIPILDLGLAATLFHEFGHHVQHTRSHGIKKRGEEQYAESYRGPLMSSYALARAEDLNKCFDELERTTESNSLVLDWIRKIRQGWNKEYEKACRVERGQATDD